MQALSSSWPHAHASGILTIDLKAIAANFQQLRAMAPGADCAAVVKADAYGLGAARVAPALAQAGATIFCVAHVDEGIALRAILPDAATIFVLHGPRPQAIQACLDHDLRPVLNTGQQVMTWRDAARIRGGRLAAALQVDSGMGRFGLGPQEVTMLAADPTLTQDIEITHILSHLACADAPGSCENERQKSTFARLSALFPMAKRSLAASSGIFLGPAYHGDMIRPGAALYGINPVPGHPNPMQPVVRLQAHVLQIREIGPGDGVGYGLTYRATEPRRIAILGAGYADGLHRHGASGGCAWWNDLRLPMIGRISMDSLAVDISAIPHAQVSPDMMLDLLGPHYGVDDLATARGTIGYEVLTSLGQRFARRYL